MKLPRYGLWAALALLGACTRPGQPPPGQPPLSTFTSPNGFSALVDRFNSAKPGQIQVVALFSPT